MILRKTWGHKQGNGLLYYLYAIGYKWKTSQRRRLNVGLDKKRCIDPEICQVKSFRQTFVESPTRNERSLCQGFVATFTGCQVAHQTQLLFFIFHDVQQQQRCFYSMTIQTNYWIIPSVNERMTIMWFIKVLFHLQIDRNQGQGYMKMCAITHLT